MGSCINFGNVTSTCDSLLSDIGMTIFRKWGSNQKHQAFEESFVRDNRSL